MRIENDVCLDFQDVLIRPKRSTLTSRGEVDLTRDFTFRNSKQSYHGIPIIAANMDTVGTFNMAAALEKHELSVALHKHYPEKELIEFFSNTCSRNNHWYSMGITDRDLEKFNNVVNAGVDIKNVCIDVANGYQEVFVDFVKRFRENNLCRVIMAGNVVSGEMTEALILAGADIVKGGIGSGSSCITRKVAGVGMPQLSCVIEMADAAHGLKGHICSDGGITCPGDLGKSVGGGADFVMMGGVFAGHDECDADIVFNDNGAPIAMKFYGMSSKEAQEKHNGGLKKHRAAEGKCVEVIYRGSVENTVLEYLGGLRSTCTYTGAARLKDLSKCTTFVKVHHQLNTVFGN